MIKLKKITVQNFLSYGNVATSFDFTTHTSTLVRGKNGSGKSTIFLDAVIYALYGKPYRAINKPQLLNSINKKEMLVELEFSIGIDEYLIRRGMRPNIFDIFKNNILVEQNAAIRDYQEFLEGTILKISEKTFKQIAILGAGSYTPFMKLATGQRRELVESILDIEVFSRMNAVLRDRMNATRDEVKIIEHKIEIKKHEAQGQQRLINVIKENTKARVEEYDNQKASLLLELAKYGMSTNELNEQLDDLEKNKPPHDQSEFDRIQERLGIVNRTIDRLTKTHAHVHDLEYCPTCKQDVSEEHNNSVADDLKKELIKFTSEKSTLETEFGDLTILSRAYNEHRDSKLSVMDNLRVSMNSQNSVRKQIATIEESINSILSNSNDLELEQEKLKKIGQDALALVKRNRTLSEEKHLQDVSAQLLKDSGIKTAVVKEYLPILNQLINKYLGMFNFFVDFTLDENFEEVIKSRGRDVFSYASFSEGEKKRLDFSILMAFRQLASLKNSAKTNILVLDELLDGAFDLEAKSLVQDIVTAIQDANVIVVSHADSSNDGFDRTIVVEKVGDFSEYSEVD